MPVSNCCNETFVACAFLLPPLRISQIRRIVEFAELLPPVAPPTEAVLASERARDGSPPKTMLPALVSPGDPATRRDCGA
jgi:hypothetical protein